MLAYVLRKIINKKWLNLCLLTGIVFFTAVVVCHPMLEKGSQNKILQQLFSQYAQEKNSSPSVLSYSSGTTGEFHSLQEVCDKMDSYEEDWLGALGIDKISSQQCVSLSSKNASSSLGGRNWMLSAGYLRGLEDHIRIVKSMDGEPDNGIFPCLVSESTMDTYGMAAGEVLTYPNVKNAQGQRARFVIQGIFAMDEDTDPYWNKTPEDFDHMLFVSQDVFDTLLAEYGFHELTYETALVLDHTQITWRNASACGRHIGQWAQEDEFSTDLRAILADYDKQSRSASVVLWVLELPCLVLLLLFIYMVSGQILISETGEIAAFRSRGVSRIQLLRLYLLQSAVLALAGMVLGLVVGFFFCRIAAGTDAFLTFTGKDTSLYQVNGWMPVYAAAGELVVVLFMTLPVWKRSDTTIVKQKARAGVGEKKPFWERFFLDILLMLISLYLLYNYQKQGNTWDAGTLDGGQMDPMVFLDASLFTFSCALLMIRLSRYLLRLIWRIGARRWRPALYASFLEMLRTFSKRSFLSVFLIMTVANGIFDANMARTMNKNGEERLKYDVGCDVRLQERWESQYIVKRGEQSGYYIEPDYAVYQELVQQGLCRTVTKVLIDEETTVSLERGKKLNDCMLMGIHTKEFGETAELMDGINEKHWFHALNALAEKADGVIISRNMADELDLSVGDAVNYARFRPFGGSGDRETRDAVAQVCAIVDGFPGYGRYGQDRERYLIVVNYAELSSHFDQTPYQIWMRMADNTTADQVREALRQKQINLEQWTSLSEEFEKRENSPLIQVTNGLFTMNFLISLMICSAGFLIYWIMSIRNREQLFGIYRAMGMRLRELAAMLFNEQIFGSLLSIGFGVAAGVLATKLFTRLTALVYLPEKHTITIQIFSYGSDMARIFGVLGGVIIICLMVLWKIVKGMKVAQALRMGEEE